MRSPVAQDDQKIVQQRRDVDECETAGWKNRDDGWLRVDLVEGAASYLRKRPRRLGGGEQRPTVSRSKDFPSYAALMLVTPICETCFLLCISSSGRSQEQISMPITTTCSRDDVTREPTSEMDIGHSTNPQPMGR